MEFSIQYFFQELHTPFLDRLVTAFTSLGDKGWFFIVLGVVLFCCRKTRRMGTAVLLSLAAGAIVGNLFLKNLLMRERPCWIDTAVPLLIENPRDYSFPSGHTLAAFETAFSIYYVNRRWGAVMVVFAAAMALSRLYLFVHFPSDVLSGMALGVFIAWNVGRFVEKYKIYDILESSKNKNAE